MKTILTMVLMLVVGVAVGQDVTRQRSAEGSRDHMLYARQATINYGMVIAPGYRSTAVNQSGNPVRIALGDASFATAQGNEPVADALRAQADAAYAAGNYGPAANLFGQARAEYLNCNGAYVAASEWWRRSLHSW